MIFWKFWKYLEFVDYFKKIVGGLLEMNEEKRGDIVIIVICGL